MTTGRQSTSRLLLGALLACLALGGCAGGGSDGRSPDPPSVAVTTPDAAPPGVGGAETQPPALTPVGGACAAGPGFRCLTLRVDLDRPTRTTPASGRISLRVAVQRGARPPRGYLVYLTGGPGQPGVRFGRRVLARLGTVTAGYGVVLIDQRGTGASAVRCPTLQRSVGSSDVAVAARGTVEACARSVGTRRSAFTSAATVADLDELRQALGAQRLSLAGVSYGTLVAERYALAYPDRVRRLVLDSVVPQQGADVLLASSMAAVPRVLKLVCAQTRCRHDVATDLRAALAFGADDVGLLDTVVADSIGVPQLDAVPDALHAAAHGDLGALQGLAASARAASAVSDPARFSSGLHAATLCAESDVPWRNATAVPADREQGLAQARAQLTPGRLGGFEPRTAVDNGLADTCRRWPPLDPAPKTPTGPLPAVPTLLLAGEWDLSTPLEDARAELKRTTTGTLVVIPRMGHSVLSRDPSGCALRVTGRFLAGRPAGGCEG